MNIFVLDEDPQQAAKAMCDRHVVKMVLETAQILSTVIRKAMAHRSPDDLYRATHANHPCVLWAGESRNNARWLRAHGDALACEYTHRYGKKHKSLDVIWRASGFFGELPTGPRTPFAQCMPESYQGPSAVEAYRAYYIGEKASFANWTKREPPAWWPTSNEPDTKSC